MNPVDYLFVCVYSVLQWDRYRWIKLHSITKCRFIWYGVFPLSHTFWVTPFYRSFFVPPKNIRSDSHRKVWATLWSSISLAKANRILSTQVRIWWCLHLMSAVCRLLLAQYTLLVTHAHIHTIIKTFECEQRATITSTSTKQPHTNHKFQPLLPDCDIIKLWKAHRTDKILYQCDSGRKRGNDSRGEGVQNKCKRQTSPISYGMTSVPSVLTGFIGSKCAAQHKQSNWAYHWS